MQHSQAITQSFDAQLYAVTVTFIPESDHVKQNDVLANSRESNDSKNDVEI